MIIRTTVISLIFSALAALGSTNAVSTNAPLSWILLESFQAKGASINLRQILAEPKNAPDLILMSSPAAGASLELTRQQIAALIAKSGITDKPEWSGAERVKITRPGRTLVQDELCQMLTEHLQDEVVRSRGELELRFSRPWSPVLVPNEPISIRVLELPTAGVTANFIARFELRIGAEVLGSWQAGLQAKVWRDVWVARSPQIRGRLLRDADLGVERRDILATRDPFPVTDMAQSTLELAESLPAGSPVLTRSVRQRPIVIRGKTLDAILRDGALMIAVRVEAMEDGLRGQTIRVRNQKTRRELQAKVQDEQTVLISL